MNNKAILIAIPNIGTVSTNFMAQMLGLNYGKYHIGYQFIKSNLLFPNILFMPPLRGLHCLIFIKTERKNESRYFFLQKI